MKKPLLLLISFSLWAFSSKASLLDLEPGAKSISGINISHGATTSWEGQNRSLLTVGSGLRRQKILLNDMDLYVAQLLVSHPTRFVPHPSETLNSLQDSSTVALHLTFLQGLDAAKVRSLYRDSLAANHVDLQLPEIKEFLTVISRSGNADEGKTISLVIHKNKDDSETLIYEDTEGRQSKVRGKMGLTGRIFSIWLGIPLDKGLADLKKSLLESRD